MKFALKTLLAAGIAAVTSAAVADVVTVTPDQVGTSYAPNQWYQTNYRDVSNSPLPPANPYTSTTTGAISTTYAQSGNGSVEMSSTDGTGKVDFEYDWGLVPGRTLGNLTTLSFDWLRSGTSSSANWLEPALRVLYIDSNGNYGSLNYEFTYNNAGAAPTNTWQTTDVMTSKVWENRANGRGGDLGVYSNTIGQWILTPGQGDPLSANTVVYGINFGIGSGWSGTFSGAVDNVTIGFGADTPTTYNFEVASVPEPGTYAMFGAGALFFAGVARSRRSKKDASTLAFSGNALA